MLRVTVTGASSHAQPCMSATLLLVMDTFAFITPPHARDIATDIIM